jgi:hypothetical protein
MMTCQGKIFSSNCIISDCYIFPTAKKVIMGKTLSRKKEKNFLCSFYRAAPECQTYSLAAANRGFCQTVSLALRTKTRAFAGMTGLLE